MPDTYVTMKDLEIEKGYSTTTTGCCSADGSLIPAHVAWIDGW